jgi:hypothetical protein
MRTRMITFFLICQLGWLEGCSSTKVADAPPALSSQTLVLDKYVHPLSRMEQIDAIKDCQEVGLRPRLVYGKRVVNGYTADVVLDVICANKYVF